MRICNFKFLELICVIFPRRNLEKKTHTGGEQLYNFINLFLRFS